MIPSFRPVPLVKEIEAESCSGPPKEMIVADKQANGGVGGKAVRLTPGGPGLTTDIEVKPGLYAIFTIARDPGGKTGNDLLTLDVKEHATGQTRSWTMMGVYREAYFAVGQMYFPAYAGGRHTVTVKLATRFDRPPSDPSFKDGVDEATLTLKGKTLVPLLLDRLEVRDVLGNCARKAAKTKRMLTSDEELAQIRSEFAASKHPPPPAPRSADERKKRNDELWAKVPDFNEHIFNVGTSGYAWVIGRDRPGIISDAAIAFEKTGDAESGWDGAVTLCALAEKFPALDYFAQTLGKFTNLTAGEPFRFSNPPGKSVYRGWSGPDMARLAVSYDRLFDFIKGNQALAAYVGTRIPWVNTPDDVIKLLDTNILQAGMDDCNRTYIEGNDEPKAIIPLVQGVNEVSERMLDEGIFKAMCMNMTFRGGIDDQAINSYSRDGVHYIGSVGYLSKDLQLIAEHLHRYSLAGGAKQFDVLDEKVCPQMKEADATVEQLRLAGGFRLVQGDAGDLRLGREANIKPWPSRVLGGFGATALESGQFGDDPLSMRGVGITFGLGRGHAHQDTLNIELFAHGCRMAPDLGGRHEPPLKGYPNMRWNKVHNLVEVDGRNFENTYAGSTVSGTGWNTSFSPQPGAQFMEHHARATSHTNVTLYARQTAMVDVGAEDSYLFDVFRVRGGSLLTYCFHGCPADKLDVNSPLKPAERPATIEYLKDHFKGTKREGSAPAMLQADWPMKAELQKRYQGEKYQPDRVATTRLALFGHFGDKVMVGNAYSEKYDYNFPFLYVQAKQDDDGARSVFPAIIEPFAGKPLLTEKREVAIKPPQKGADAAVSLEVKTAAGATDLLYASGKPSEAVTLDGKVKATGKFAMISRDGEGLRLAELVGGTELGAADIVIKADRASYEARITEVSYNDRNITVAAPWPTRLLRGAVVGIGNDRILHAFKLSGLKPEGKGTRLTHEKTARYYQSAIVTADEKAGTVEAEIEPAVFGCDTEFVDGTTVSNEKQDKFWRATLVEGDRWMNLGFPGYRGSWPSNVSLGDVPDSNRDGRRTLKLLGGDQDLDAQSNSLTGRVLLEMEVTKITSPGQSGTQRGDPELYGETFYFKLPADEKYQRGGWQYANRWLVNEDGSRKWLAMYPGSSFLWKLAGGFAKGDFTDANKDGKTKLSAYLFGPGDLVRVDTFAYVRRESPGVYEVRANVPCTIALPRGEFSKAQISPDGKSFASISAKPDGARLEVKLTERDLADGVVQLRLLK